MERLRYAAIEGRLDADELDERLTAAYNARLCADLETLTADVTPPPPARRPAARPVAVRPPRTVNRVAVVSLVLALSWWVWMGSIAAVIAGHIALRQIANSGGTQSGRGLAVAGLMIGYLMLLPLVFGFLLGGPFFF